MNDKIVTITFLTDRHKCEYKTAAYPFSLKTLELIAELGELVNHVEVIDFIDPSHRPINTISEGAGGFV